MTTSAITVIRETSHVVELQFCCRTCGNNTVWLCQKAQRKATEDKIAADSRCYGCQRKGLTSTLPAQAGSL